MTPETRQAIVAARTADYAAIMRTTIFGFVAIAAVLHLGPDAFSLPLLLITVTVTAYGVLAGGTALDDIDNLRGDMTPEMRETSYGSAVMSRDIGMLKTISAGLIGATGVGLFLAVLF